MTEHRTFVPRSELSPTLQRAIGPITRTWSDLAAIPCDHVSAGIALLGLALELGAVVAVARKFVDRGDLWKRLENFFRRPEPAKAIRAPAGTATEANTAVGGMVEQEAGESPEERSPEEQLAQLRMRIADLQASFEDKVDTEIRQVRRELAERSRQVTREAIRGDEEIREEIRQQTLDALAEQKREASFFAVGLALQMVAAFVLLAC